MTKNLIAILTFITISPSSRAEPAIETKYFMFKIHKVHFDDVLQLKKPEGKLDFGDGVVLMHDDIEEVISDPPKNFTHRVALKKPIRFPNVILEPKCVLIFSEFPNKTKSRYLLYSIDCESSAVEIDRTKLKGVFHSTFAKDKHHFACSPVVSVTDVPLVGGSKVPPGHFISADDFDPDKPINKVKSISKDHSN